MQLSVIWVIFWRVWPAFSAHKSNHTRCSRVIWKWYFANVPCGIALALKLVGTLRLSISNNQPGTQPTHAPNILIATLDDATSADPERTSYATPKADLPISWSCFSSRQHSIILKSAHAFLVIFLVIMVIVFLRIANIIDLITQFLPEFNWKESKTVMQFWLTNHT